MSLVFALILGAFVSITLAAERPLEIDPNTKTQGGADVRGSGANAGAGAQTDNRIETGPERDKPISERKPQEREPENAAKGATAKPQH